MESVLLEAKLHQKVNAQALNSVDLYGSDIPSVTGRDRAQSSWQDPGGLQRSVGHRTMNPGLTQKGKQPAMGLGSHSCNCLSLGLCLGDGAPGYQIGVRSGQ